MAALIDTNVLVYRFDARFPQKQARAVELLREGIRQDSVRVAHQCIIELVPALTHAGILAPEDARREAEELLLQFTILYPNDDVVRTALRGAPAYQLSWSDEHLWAYAEVYGLDELISEDFQHERQYGSVRVVNPFLV